MKKHFGIISLALALAAGCTTVTHLDGEWRSEAVPQGGFRSPVVITLRDDPIERMHFGNMLSDELKRKGIKAVPGAEAVPAGLYDKNGDGRPDPDADKEAIQKFLNEKGYDSILTVTVRNTEKEKVYRKGTEQTVEKIVFDKFQNAWIKTTEVIGQPGYYENLTTVHIETELYNSADGTLCWRGASATMNPLGTPDLAGSYSKRIAKVLLEQGLLRH
jgi:hypothetical protein